MPKKMSEQQWRFLLSAKSPLSDAQKAKLLRERRSGHVTVSKTRRKAK